MGNILKKIIYILTLTCDQSAVLMSKSQETQLTRAERRALRLHLLICKSCRKYEKQLNILRNLLRKISLPSTYETDIPSLLDADQAQALKKRISKKIRENLDSM